MRKAIGVIVLLAAALAQAGECPIPQGASPALAAVDGEARLAFIQRGMRYAAHKARVWAWSSAGVLMAVGNFQLLGALKVPDRGERIDLWVGAASLAFSVAQMAAVPPLVTIDQWTVDRHVRRAAAGADRCALLAEAEKFLKRDAVSEERGTGLAMQAVTLFFNIGTGAVLGIAFNRWDSAATSIFIGSALGELQILSQPTESVRLLERYRAGDMTPRKGEKTAMQWHLLPTVTHDGWGLSTVLSF